MNPPLSLGFIPLVDCAPLVLAKELGFFAAAGLPVELCKCQGWDQLSQKLVEGRFEAAHALITLPLRLSFSSAAPPVGYDYVLSRGGNAITVSNALFRAGATDGPSLAAWLEKAPPEVSLRFGLVHSPSTHEVLLRRFLASGGLQVGGRISLKILPPQEMVHALREGLIDGFCAGEPWNQRATTSKLGAMVATSLDLFRLASPQNPPARREEGAMAGKAARPAETPPEKVLAVTNSFLSRRREEYQALLSALDRACAFLADLRNAAEAARILAQKPYVNTQAEIIERALSGRLDGGFKRTLDLPSFLSFGGRIPADLSRSHAGWYFRELYGADPAREAMALACCREAA